MKKLDFEKIPLDELWALHEEISRILSSRIVAEKEQLEKRLVQLHRGKDLRKPALAGLRSVKANKDLPRRRYPKVHPKYRNPADPTETWAGRGKQLDEILDVLDALWTGEPAAHEGEHWRIPPSTVELKPAQRPRPPVLLGGFSPAALARVGRRADGWLPGWIPPAALKQLWSIAVAAAEAAGRDPGTLRQAVRFNPREGTAVATVADLAACVDQAREIGIDEAFVDFHHVAQDVPHALELAQELRAVVKD